MTKKPLLVTLLVLATISPSMSMFWWLPQGPQNHTELFVFSYPSHIHPQAPSDSDISS